VAQWYSADPLDRDASTLDDILLLRDGDKLGLSTSDRVFVAGTDLFADGIPDISPPPVGDLFIAGGKIFGGGLGAGKGAGLMVASLAAAPPTLGASVLALAPGAAWFGVGLASFKAGIDGAIEFNHEHKMYLYVHELRIAPYVY
jgi:hypothetical protein